MVKQYYVSKTTHNKDDADLRNRYLHIHPTKEWSVQPNLAEPSSTRQVAGKPPDKLPDKLSTKNQYIRTLVKLVGNREMSIKEMLVGLGLKDRESFMNVYLNPAINPTLTPLNNFS